MVQIIIGKVFLVIWVHRLTVTCAGEDQNKEEDETAPRHHRNVIILCFPCRCVYRVEDWICDLKI